LDTPAWYVSHTSLRWGFFICMQHSARTLRFMKTSGFEGDSCSVQPVPDWPDSRWLVVLWVLPENRPPLLGGATLSWAPRLPFARRASTPPPSQTPLVRSGGGRSGSIGGSARCVCRLRSPPATGLLLASSPGWRGEHGRERSRARRSPFPGYRDRGAPARGTGSRRR
jgi:hypothetical protein